MRQRSTTSPLVIGHRGAPGYLPENTIESFALALGMGVEAVEFDVVLTRDGVPVLLHDHYLEALTDVRQRFPGRTRENGHDLVLDFTWEEIQQLRVLPRREAGGQLVFPARYEAGGSFRIPSLCETLAFFRELERTLQRRWTLFVELKAPALHAREGLNLSGTVIRELKEHGYAGCEDPCWLVCIDSNALRQIRHESGCNLKQLQILGVSRWEEVPGDMETLRTAEGIASIAAYAEGIGPWCPLCYDNEGGERRAAPFMAEARQQGLQVMPFTFAADQFPEKEFSNFADFVRFFASELKVDGLIADHPDVVQNLIVADGG